MLASHPMKDFAAPIKAKVHHRRRFQRGSLQRRQSAGLLHWIGFWWDSGRRRSRILGPCSSMSRTQALTELAKTLEPINANAGEPSRRWTVREWTKEVFLPFIRHKWKLSTASTTGDRIRRHIIGDLGSLELNSVTRDLLQRYLEQKAAVDLSFSVVDHLRWDLRAIFRLAVQDQLIATNPAEMLFTPAAASRPSRRVLCAEQVQLILDVLDLRERLFVHLALFSGMRPGEIFALQWKHVADNYVQVVQRVYRGHIDRPKTRRSTRTVALSKSTSLLLKEWRRQQQSTEPDEWVFPSAKASRPIGRDNVWRRFVQPKLKPLNLGWASFQIMRRTHATLSREARIDPKLVADQLGHGLGVSLDVYTIAGLPQRQTAVETLEASICNRGLLTP
jgi:integrase